jgi:nitric oxide reductase subunit C
MMRTIKLAILGLVLVAVAPLFASHLSPSWFQVEAQPSWARKYNAECTLCHTTYPRLNRTGYEFKRLGYRLPQELEPGRSPASSLEPMRSSKQMPEAYTVERTGYVPSAESAESEQGERLYVALNCASCHTTAGVGGRIGPPLDGVGGRRDATFLAAHLTNPDEHARKYPGEHANLPNRMPHPHLKADEVRAMVAYLLTLPEPPAGFVVASHKAPETLSVDAPASAFVPAAETDATRAGRSLYFNLGCAACHTIQGQGGQFGPPLDGIGARRSRRYIAGHISNPPLHSQEFPGEHAGEPMMPPTEATEEQIAEIADFLMTLPAQEGVDLRPPRLADYVGISYAPGIEFEREGSVTSTTFEKREFIVFAAGAVGPNFSFFVQPLPLSEEPGFGGKFEMAQGLFNAGGARNFVQVRFGQLFNLRNSGFGGTDRGLTETVPFIFAPVNGFNPAGLGRGVSLEYTFNRTTTVKVFGNYNEAVEADEEAEEAGGETGDGAGEEPDARRAYRTAGGNEAVAAEFSRSRSVGFVLEKVIGEQGLSGLQVEVALGRTPYSLDGLGEQSVRFERYGFFANKSFVDGKNFERLNAIFGLALLRDDRFIGLDTGMRSRGYGYFVELDAIPVSRRLSVFGRYDRLRPTTLVKENTLHGGTLGVIYDPVRYARVSFEYQRLGGATTADRYRIGWQFNF